MATETLPITVALIAFILAGCFFYAERLLTLRRRLRDERLARIDHEIKKQHRLAELDAVMRERAAAEATFAADVDRMRRRQSKDPADRLTSAKDAGWVSDSAETAIAELQNQIAWKDLGTDSDDALLVRYLPVSIYVDTDDPRLYFALRDAVAEFLEPFGFEVASEMPAEHGSIFQRLTARLKEPSTKAELKRQASLAQFALQQQALGRPQAEINLQGAQTAAALAETLAASDDCVVAVGAMIAATKRGTDGKRRTVIVELTPDELISAQREGRMLHSAEAAFAMLARVRPDEFAAQVNLQADPAPALEAPKRKPELLPGDQTN